MRYIRNETIDFAGSTIHYSSYGKSTVGLVLLHGFLLDGSVWGDFLKRYPNTKTLTIDLPGFGKSEPLTKTSIEKYAEVVWAICEREDVEDIIVLGHSMGGYIALSMLSSMPERFKGLCLFHSHPYADSEQKKAERKDAITFIENNGIRPYASTALPKYFSEKYRQKYKPEQEAWIERSSEFPVDGVTSALKAMRNRPDTHHLLAEVDIPYQFIIGKKDEITPYKLILEASALPARSDVHLYPGIGHMGMYERRKGTQKAIRTFLAKCMAE